MAKPFFLFFLLIICLLSSTPESHRPPPFLGKSPRLLKTQNILVQPKYTYETRYFDQTLDHFSFNDLPKFQQHYLINSDHWVGAGPNRLGPIFLYCGNEGDIEWFAANTDFVWELAPRFGAMVIFPEHRYYGESMPYGSQKEAYKNASTLVYLTAEQALADYALLITNLKRNLSAEASPVILFGGSYGGSLVAPPPMSSPAPGTSPPSPLDPSVSNTTTSPTATFPLLPPTNATSIGSEPTLSPPAQNRSSSNSALVALGIGIGIGGAVVLVFVGVFVVWYRRRKRRRRALSESSAPLGFKDEFGITPQNWQHNAPSSKENINGLPPKFTNSPLNASCFQLPSLGSSAPPPPPPHSTSSAGSEKQNPQPQSTMGQGYPNSKTIFSYEELATATQGFSQVNLLGQGGFGYVHKGVLPNGEIVAIKQLKVGSGQGEREFQAEVAIISRVHHKHLVTLVGYCISGIQRMLVYEFVPNKTLEFHLHGKEHGPLNWEMRMKIALGSAKGLAYLHEDCQPKIIHRDIKSANILLDINFEPKVADFGLARFTSETDTHVSTRVMGTFGYLAPEYALTGKLTEKSDVFSFGVMLLELITGRRPIDKAQFLDDNIVDWARPLLNEALENGDFRSLVDSGLNGDYDSGEMSRMIACAAVCVRHLARRRPSMTQIARALEGNLPLEDLDEGLKPGHIKFNASHESSDFDTAQYREELKKFQKMAFESQNNSSVWSAPTTSFGQQPSGSSSSTHDLGSTKLVQQ